MEFNKFLEDLSISNYKKSALITYWLNDYKNYLANEESFTPRKLVKYKRGSIIKVNLGFNLGNEQGGLHYCIVLNKNDTINTPLLNIIPLSSIKDPSKKIHYTNVNLGDEVYKSLKSKLEEKNELTKYYLTKTRLMNDIVEELLNILTSTSINTELEDKDLEKKLLLCNKPIWDMLVSDFNNILNDTSWNDDYIYSIIKTISDIQIDLNSDLSVIFKGVRAYNNITTSIIDIVEKHLAINQKISDEISKMKRGSIAHVDQITTISKMRIYNPKSTEDALYNIKLSNESLTLIDDKIKELFTY
ncbi:type II toxin-antitoxin system PemK/MazF family toxin [Tissierella sp. Yu-01]|uniref:type II toxin-antitoxin system PemK/MazF family toxin n=1 Tax=Tissierella sp. Yu-01 TaxID=3035694 RepID=UPI00240E587E|nr:type II toxin-antitoxin system PemK/MazF family toxin [Tissierella sp. Yu-01]WFA10377.1 type II toxin-antitoxin system PemK/MazF family toxin [Tissierella sp. Yu-01]